ncbi:archease [Candidatus Bathyarchaeota archaeon]|nr:archease [Candidatus Bathyarchaeota archaeon]
MSAKKFEFLEHTADVYVAAYGSSLAEAFENSAIAMFETMTDTKQVRVSGEDRLEVMAQDEENLLYSWLEALLLKFEVDGKLYSRFKVESINRTSEGFVLKATMWGEQFNKKRHESRTDVKAVTYHRMEIFKSDSGYMVKFILDI